MTDLASTQALPLDSLERVAAAQADWVRRHRRVAMACGGGLALLSVVLISVLLLGSRDTVSPGAVVLDGALMGIVASAFAGAMSHVRYADRARRLALSPPPPVTCFAERLGADSPQRRDHLYVTVEGGERVLLRVEEGSALMFLPERGDAVLLGTPGRNSPVLVGVPGRAFVAARRAR